MKLRAHFTVEAAALIGPVLSVILLMLFIGFMFSDTSLSIVRGYRTANVAVIKKHYNQAPIYHPGYGYLISKRSNVGLSEGLIAYEFNVPVKNKLIDINKTGRVFSAKPSDCIRLIDFGKNILR